MTEQRRVTELQAHGGVRSDHEPVHTVRAGGHHHGVLITAVREGARMRDANVDTSATATTGHGCGLAVISHFTGRGTHSGGVAKHADQQPTGSITTQDHHSLVVPYYRTGVPADGHTEAASTISTRDRLALVVPAGGGWAQTATAADREPVPTQIAREVRAVVYTDEDIDRCRFRMFALHEIAGAMVMRHHTTGGLYAVLGNKREQMAQYGNSVTPPAMAWLVGRLADAGIDVSRIIDLFCGAGGSSLGAELAGGRLVLGLNHWPRAVETHSTNFQHADHDCEDISSLSTKRIRVYLQHARPTVMIAGPECTNHTIAKGSARRKPQVASLWEDGPGSDDEQEKSRATMWDVARFAEQALLLGQPLEAIVVENVVDAFNWGAGDNGALFNAWLTAIDSLGYQHEIVWLNSMFAPPAPEAAPQSRDRMYVVFWRRDLGRHPNLLVEPPAWCLHCERVVEGRQSWKRLDRRPWGRYGAQYLYSCPACHKTALPGAFPAVTIIDDQLPAEIIGEKKPTKCRTCGKRHPIACNTRARIRAGLERLANEPFAIRLSHGGVPRPLTLPLVTLTQRHDPAMVFPIAGNTHERTRGSRARDAQLRPLDTIHQTHDRALVIPPMGSVEPRAADRAPAPTQTTTTRAGLVTR